MKAPRRLNVVHGGGERQLAERKRLARRLLQSPETVTRAEAHGFVAGIQADFKAFVRRRQRVRLAR